MPALSSQARPATPTRDRPLQALSVASEVFPLIKTGGLADVVGALPAALAREGIEMLTLAPGYPQVMAALQPARTVLALPDLFGGPARIVRNRAAGLDVLALDAPHLFDRSGNPYNGPSGADWPDNAQRFAALSRAAAIIGLEGLADFRPAIVHAHDWQTGLLPAYLHYGKADRPGTVMTVHNLAFQGNFAPHLLGELGFPSSSFTYDQVEYFGSIGFLKAGLQFADRITTVSPTYAAEITTPEQGMGLDGLLRARSAALSGILNGIDVDVWNPETDQYLAARFSRADPAPRSGNTAALRARFGLSDSTRGPLLGVVSRLSGQKGLDILLAALPAILAWGVQVVVLGAGDPALEAGFRAAAAAAPGMVAFTQGYDEPLAHLIQGGCDALLVPSRFEPCGLTQLCALRYGAIPVVARVGGLNDTVIDANEMALSAGVATGFQFAPVDRPSLERVIAGVVAAFRRPAVWRALQANAMAADVGWTRAAERYATLYRQIARAEA